MPYACYPLVEITGAYLNVIKDSYNPQAVRQLNS